MALHPRLLHQDIQARQVRATRTVPPWQQTLPVPSADVVLAEGFAEQVSRYF